MVISYTTSPLMTTDQPAERRRRGRPSAPGERWTFVLRATPKEREEIEAAIERSGMPGGAWLLKVALEAARA